MAYLERNPRVLQIYITWSNPLIGIDPKTRLVDMNWDWGFTFNPGLRRISQYLLCPGGYSGITDN